VSEEMTIESDINMKIILDYIHYVGKGRLDWRRLYEHPKLDRENIITALASLMDEGLVSIHPGMDEPAKDEYRVLTLTEAGKQKVLENKKKLKEKTAEREKTLGPVDWELRIIILIPLLRFKDKLTIRNLVSFSKLNRETVSSSLNSLRKKQRISLKLNFSKVSDDEKIDVYVTEAGTKWIQENN